MPLSNGRQIAGVHALWCSEVIKEILSNVVYGCQMEDGGATCDDDGGAHLSLVRNAIFQEALNGVVDAGAAVLVY